MRGSIISKFLFQESDVAKTDQKPLLEVRNLKTYFYTEDGVVSAVDGVSFEVYPVRCWALWANRAAAKVSHRFRSCV